MAQPDPFQVVEGYYNVLLSRTVELSLKFGSDLSRAPQEIQCLGKALMAEMATLIYTLDQVVPGFATTYGTNLAAVADHYWPRSDGTVPPTPEP